MENGYLQPRDDGRGGVELAGHVSTYEFAGRIWLEPAASKPTENHPDFIVKSFNVHGEEFPVGEAWRNKARKVGSIAGDEYFSMRLVISDKLQMNMIVLPDAKADAKQIDRWTVKFSRQRSA